MLIALCLPVPAYRTLTIEQHKAISAPQGLFRKVIGKVGKPCLRQDGTAVAKQTHL